MRNADIIVLILKPLVTSMSCGSTCTIPVSALCAMYMFMWFCVSQYLLSNLVNSNLNFADID